MARYIEDAGINQPLDVVSMVMEDYIYHHRYTRTDWNGEPVYSCRDAYGKERYLVWSYASGILHLEAWLKGAFGKEANLSGKSGKEFQKSLEELLNKLRTHSGNTANIGYIGEDPFTHHEEVRTPPQSAQSVPNGMPAMPYKPQNTAYIPPQGSPNNMSGNPYGMPGTQGGPNGMPGGIQGIPNGTQGMPNGMPDNIASAALVMGIIGLVLSMCSPIFGLILGIIGKNRCQTMDTAAGQGKAANILCTIAIILSIVMLVFNVFIGIGGLF